MQVERVDHPAAFLMRAEPLLLRDEARHNLILGLAGTLRDRPAQYPEFRLWLVASGEDVVGAALRTPPYNLVLAQPATDGVLEALADAIDEELPGAVGAVPEIERFGELWSARRGARTEVRMAQGIYAVDELIPPAAPPGEARRAGPDDRGLVVEWIRAFAGEALAETIADAERLERMVDERLDPSVDDVGFLLWDDGVPVSLAGFGGRTPNGARIGPVYTPPELRGRGYGSAITAAATADRFAAGRRFCFLYTDLANPTSNRIYLAIGYRRVCDSLEVAFVR